MLGRALGPVALHVDLAAGAAGRDLLRRPEVTRRSLRVGVLVTDPADRPGRGSRLVAGLRLGLEQARDLDASVTAVGATPFGPALLDAASSLLDQGHDVLVVTSAGMAGLVGPLCTARGVALVIADEGDRVATAAQHRRGVLRRTERHWQEAYVLGQWASRHLDGALFQLVTRHEEQGDGVLALRAGYAEQGGTVAGSVEVWPKSAAAAAQVARVSGARVIAVHATGNQLVDIVRALRAARVPAEIVVAGRGVHERDLVELARSGALYAASAWHGSAERTDACVALGWDVARALVDAARRDAVDDLGSLADAGDDAEERGLVIRRAASGRVAVVARRTEPGSAPDFDAVAVGTAIAALPHHG